MKKRAERDHEGIRSRFAAGDAFSQAPDAPGMPPVVAAAVTGHGRADERSDATNKQVHGVNRTRALTPTIQKLP